MTEPNESPSRWPASPVLLEVNTLPWLREQAHEHGVPMDLAALPPAAWDALVTPGIDAVWLMGAWERSPAGRAIALEDPTVMRECREALPDMTGDDFVGSAYCIRSYTPEALLGGESGLRAAREALAARGIRLILDFVPNHVAIDHRWATESPDLLLRATQDDLAAAPGDFHNTPGGIFACGKDPNFPPWRDTLQVNAFALGARKAAVAELERIAGYCDGVRCDMAMLLLSDVFASTWGARAGQPPAAEFWPEVIGAVRDSHPGFVFVAEAYWGTQSQLQEHGFNFCYDKLLYDRLRSASALPIREHLTAPVEYQSRLVRFVENHDEKRVPVAFGAGRDRAGAVAALTLPGARMLYEGQSSGRTTRLPVFLTRRPADRPSEDVRAFYQRLSAALAHPAVGPGEWRMLDTQGWPDNRSNENLLAWSWELGDSRLLVVVNYSGVKSQGRVAFPWPGSTTAERQLRDLLSGETYWRATAELQEQGLFVDLEPWQSHVLDATPALP